VAESKGLQFAIEVSADTPKTVYTDVNRLQQILKNLLSNAFKFTEQGKVTMRIQLVESGTRAYDVDTLNHAGKVLAFSVTDTGIGIAKDKQKLIFEAFQQADGTTNRKYGGTGLGLTISREIARLLGGAIELDSQPGQGSTFTLYLPQLYSGYESVKDNESELELPVPDLPKDVNFSGKKVLLVDDDMRNIFALTCVLEAQNIKVIYAENGKLGIEMLQANPGVDLILMDVMMPDMDGIEATQEIRKLAEFEKLPIISLTAKAMKGDREKCLAAGASDYITKPVDPAKLLSLMHVWFKKSEASGEW
jgi:CheY-like chemotaxis protein